MNTDKPKNLLLECLKSSPAAVLKHQYAQFNEPHFWLDINAEMVKEITKIQDSDEILTLARQAASMIRDQSDLRFTNKREGNLFLYLTAQTLELMSAGLEFDPELSIWRLGEELQQIKISREYNRDLKTLSLSFRGISHLSEAGEMGRMLQEILFDSNDIRVRSIYAAQDLPIKITTTRTWDGHVKRVSKLSVPWSLLKFEWVDSSDDDDEDVLPDSSELAKELQRLYDESMTTEYCVCDKNEKGRTVGTRAKTYLDSRNFSDDTANGGA